MARLQKHARALIDLILAELTQIDDEASPTLREVKYDPEDAYNRLVKIRDLAARLKRRVNEDLEPMLQRNERNRESAPDEEWRRLIEQRIDEIEQAINNQNKIVTLRRAE